MRTLPHTAVHPLERLIRDNPSFHTWPDDSPANCSVAPDALMFIHDQLLPGMNTLETGAGQTTVAFAIAGTHHICITPQREQADRIRDYCDELSVQGDLTFVFESSDAALPRISLLPDSLDFIFIDGAHRFPFPCLDWHYTQGRLRVGGIVGVDDCRLPSVRVLHDFLCGDQKWQLVQVIDLTSFFRKVRGNTDEP